MTEQLPFDVAGLRTIKFDYRDLDSAANCRQEIAKQIRAIESNPDALDTPISAAIDFQSLSSSNNPLENSIADMLKAMQSMQFTLDGIQSFLVSPESKSDGNLLSVVDTQFIEIIHALEGICSAYNNFKKLPEKRLNSYEIEPNVLTILEVCRKIVSDNEISSKVLSKLYRLSENYSDIPF